MVDFPDVLIYRPAKIHYLKCNSCGKQVSSGYIPVPSDTPDGGLVVRAWIECPECMEKRNDKEHSERP